MLHQWCVPIPVAEEEALCCMTQQIVARKFLDEFGRLRHNACPGICCDSSGLEHPEWHPILANTDSQIHEQQANNSSLHQSSWLSCCRLPVYARDITLGEPESAHSAGCRPFYSAARYQPVWGIWGDLLMSVALGKAILRSDQPRKCILAVF